MQQTLPTYLPSANPKVPAAQFPFRHCKKVQIRFMDIDMLGHLNNNVYLAFMDLAKVDYFATIEGSMPDMRHFNMVVVHIDIDFYAPTFFGEKVEVWSTVTKIGARSLHMEQRLVESDSGETRAIGKVVMSGFDPATNKSLPINDYWRNAIADYEGRNFPSPLPAIKQG